MSSQEELEPRRHEQKPQKLPPEELTRSGKEREPSSRVPEESYPDESGRVTDPHDRHDDDPDEEELTTG